MSLAVPGANYFPVTHLAAISGPISGEDRVTRQGTRTGAPQRGPLSFFMPGEAPQ